MQLEGADAVTAWRTLLGPTNSATAREQAPASLRARFGTGPHRYAIHAAQMLDAKLLSCCSHGCSATVPCSGKL